ncbi:MAG: hypothetical protein O2942_11145 [Proteobacteria bacterium]|nr:hypothetical protein [Pseudomonadota bacterium]
MEDNSKNALPKQENIGFESILIRYDGLDADNHQIDLHDLGVSVQGISKIITTIATFSITKNYKKGQRNLDCRVVVGVPKENCYSLQAFIEVLDKSPFLSTAAAGICSGLTVLIFQYVWALLSGRDKEMDVLRTALIESMSQNGKREDRLLDIIDKMAMGLLSSAKQAVQPIERSCKTIKFGNKEGYYTTVDTADKKVIHSEDVSFTNPQPYNVFITELDMKNFTCKVSLIEDLHRRFNAKITDPQIELPNNKYVVAMADKKAIIVIAKQRLQKDIVKEFIISDIKNDAQRSLEEW